MATKYLDVDATGAADGSSWTDAWTTFTAAFAGASSNDTVLVADGTYDEGTRFYPNTAKTMTFTSDSGVAANVKMQGSSYCMLLGLTPILTFNNITFDGAANDVEGIQTNVGSPVLTINGCIVTGGVPYNSWGNAGSLGPSLTATDSTFTATGADRCITALDMASLILANCTLDASASSAPAVYIEGTSGRIEITDCPSILGGVTAGNAVGDTISKFIIDGSTISTTGTRYGIRVADYCKNLYLNNNIVTATGQSAVVLGEEAAADVDDGFGSILITNNTLTSENGSALSIEFGCDGGEYEGNTTEGTTHSFKVTGDDNSVHHNICLGVHALVVFGDRNRVINNTIKGATGTWPLIFGGPQGALYTNANGWYYSKNNVCYNNIVVSTDATFPAYTDYEGNKNLGEPRIATDAMNDFMDYNCYWNTASTLIARIGVTPTDCETVAELQAAWGNAGTAGAIWNEMYYQINDLNSLMVDPQLDSNYKPTNSQVLQGGKPDINGNLTSMGASSAGIGISNDMYGSGMNDIYGNNDIYD